MCLREIHVRQCRERGVFKHAAEAYVIIIWLQARTSDPAKIYMKTQSMNLLAESLSAAAYEVFSKRSTLFDIKVVVDTCGCRWEAEIIMLSKIV